MTLTRKGRVVGKARLVDGTARVRIRARLSPGRTHRIVVRWAGNADAAGSQQRVNIKIARRKR